MGRLHDMVKKILMSYSYDIVEDREGDIFVARKESRMVMVSTGPENDKELTDFVNNFVASTADFRGQRIIATLSHSPPPDVIKIADENGVAVWSRETLESEMGRLAMKEIIDSGDKIEQEPEVSEVPDLETKVKDWGEQIVQPKITLEDVTELAKYTIRGFRYELELLPYYIYEYTCEVVIEGKNTGEKRLGLVGVNALTGDHELWKSRFELIPELRWTHTRLEPKIEPEKAESLAHDGVVGLNTLEVENIVDRGTALIIEKKKVRPKEGTTILKKKGLVYLPVWCIEGSNGIMLVNAVTGKIIKEDFYKE